MIFLGIVFRLNVKQKITKQNNKTENNGGGENVDVMVSLKYLSNFWRTFKIRLINCETNLILTWSESCVLSDTNANQATKSAITDKKLYVPIATLSTQDNAKLLQQLKSGFKRTIN